MHKMANLPKTYRKLVVQKLTTDFRAAVTIETVSMCQPKDGEICIKNRYVGINASDVHMTKGLYFVDGKVPFDIGFEGVGEVMKVGEGVTSPKVGDSVGYLSHNAYADYVCVPATDTLKIPEAKPEYVVLLVSGLTSAIGLDMPARIEKGETVLVTAAAGGTGHIAVQWAKNAGCHVVGTCSSEEKKTLLKNLGCDKVINYKKEDLAEVLPKEYPRGLDVIWEAVGGQLFLPCLQSLAVRGRLIVVGGISGYKDENKKAQPRGDLSTLPETLLFRSAAVQGYLFVHYKECFPKYYKILVDNLETGKIKAVYDMGREKKFTGMEGIIDGVEYLYSGKNIGKVVVKIS